MTCLFRSRRAPRKPGLDHSPKRPHLTRVALNPRFNRADTGDILERLAHDALPHFAN